jgi:hypothetical protein
MKITLSIDSKETIELNFEDAAVIVGQLADDEKYASFYSALVEHPSSEVRSTIAYKTCLPQTSLRKLAQDSSFEVVKNVASNETALAKFRLPLLRELIDYDVSIAIVMAYSLYAVNEEIRGEVADYLLLHDDPKVLEIAECFLSGWE